MLSRETELLSPGFLWLFIIHHHRNFSSVWAEDLHHVHLRAVGVANTQCPVHPKHHQALIPKAGQGNGISLILTLLPELSSASLEGSRNFAVGFFGVRRGELG